MAERPRLEPLLGRKIPPDPVIEYYKLRGDRTLVRENLKRSPQERLQRIYDASLELRRGGSNTDG